MLLALNRWLDYGWFSDKTPTENTQIPCQPSIACEYIHDSISRWVTDKNIRFSLITSQAALVGIPRGKKIRRTKKYYGFPRSTTLKKIMIHVPPNEANIFALNTLQRVHAFLVHRHIYWQIHSQCTCKHSLYDVFIPAALMSWVCVSQAFPDIRVCCTMNQYD